MHQIFIFIKECNKKKIKAIELLKVCLGILDIKLPTY